MIAAPTLLFDLDGTLIERREGIGRSISYAIARLGRATPSNGDLHRCVDRMVSTASAEIPQTLLQVF
jgi:phosphoglycolate phosphatase-like HAD superfamily hydrolase